MIAYTSASVDTLRRRVSVEENVVLVSAVVHVGTAKTHCSRSVPYPEFMSMPLARLSEGKSRDDLLFDDGKIHIRLPASRNDGSQRPCVLRGARTPSPRASCRTTCDTRPRASPSRLAPTRKRFRECSGKLRSP